MPRWSKSLKIRGFLLLLLVSVPAWSQTDETIFREFQFDFSTPGARANGMGGAFVGLADEATAAYNNPAGLAVLTAPEFTLEFRQSRQEFAALVENDDFIYDEFSSLDVAQPSAIDLDRVGFTSLGFSLKLLNLSFYYANHLDYRRPEVDERTSWFNPNEFYGFTYINQHKVDEIKLDNMGISLSRRFGSLSLGMAVGLSTLAVDYIYRTSLTSGDLLWDSLARSEADHQSSKLALVLGSLYEWKSKVKIGLVLKRQPEFKYQEMVNNTNFPLDPQPIPITFKVPDSYQLGLGYQPTDHFTFLLDLDWVAYSQLSGEHFTVLSTGTIAGRDFSFEREHYKLDDSLAVHAGGEYLLPVKGNIFSFRAGAFIDPDHKTKFEGNPNPTGIPGQNPAIPPAFDIQSFIFNFGNTEDDLAITLGLGFVWRNRIQTDFAYVESDRFRRLIGSILYRF